MSLDTTNYDLSSVYSLGAVTNPNDTFSVLSLGKRFPAYYSLFQELVDSKKIPLTRNWKGELVAPASAWASAVEPYIHTDPLTIYRTLKKVRANPFDSQPPWLQKIYSEVWAKIPEYATTQKNVAPPKEEFEKFAASKLEEVKTLADNQVKLASAGPLRPNEFTYDGNLYTVNKMTSVNGEETLGENRAGSPYATLDVVDRSGKTDRLIFIPESYLTSGERTANKTFINGSFLDQDFLKDLNAINIRNKGSVDNLFAMRFGDSGFVISESKLKEKYPKISQSLNQGQASLNTTDDTELVSFAGKLAYKFKTQQDFQGIQYIATGVGPPIAYPVEKNDVTLDAYFTGDNYGDKVSFEKIGSGPGSGHVVRQGNVILDTIQLYPEPQKPDWGKFIATGAGIWLAGSGLAAVLNPATTASFATQVGTAVGLSGTAAAVTGGAAIGAALYGAAGADPLTGAVLGGLGELATVSNYAEPVGRALGATTTKAAVVVGNIAISSALSGLSAAALGQDVGKSMLAGGITGGIKAGSQEIASTILGGPENLAKIADSLGFYGATGAQQVADILSASLAQGIVSEISGGKPFAEAFGQSLVANGVSTKIANEVVEGMRVNAPTTRAVFNATRQITGVAATAALNNQDVSLALENAAPGIILTSFKELTTPDKAVAEQVKQSQDEGMEEVPLSASDQDVLDEIKPQAPPDELLAGGDTSQLPVEDQELLNQIQDVAQRPDITGQEGSTQLAGPQAPSFIDLIDRQNERLVGGPQLSTETDGGVTINTYRQPVVGTLPDGRQYTYNIVIDVDTGERFYEYSTEIPSGQELVADTSVITASRNKPDFQTMYAEPGAGGGGGDIAADIESIISGEGLVPEEIVEVSQPSPVIPELQVPIVVPREPESVFTPTEQPTIVEPTQPPPVIEQPIPEVPTGEITDQELEQAIQEEVAPTPEPLPLEPQPEPVIEDEIKQIIQEELFSPTPTTPEEPIAEQPIEEEVIPPAQEEVIPEEPITPPVAEEEVTPPVVEESVEPIPVEEEIQLPTPVQPEPEVLPPEIPEEVTQEEIENIIAEELFGPQMPPTEQLPVEPPFVPVEQEEFPIDLPGAGEEVIGIPEGVPEGEGTVVEEEGGVGFEPEAQEPGFESEPETPITTPEEDEDQAILDLIRDLEQEEGLEEIPVEEEPLLLDEEGMEEIPLEPETPVEEVTPPTTGTRPALTVVPRQRTFQRPGEAAPYRVTGQDESGILGRKQPLFGGDEDLQRAEWNRRSLRLRRLLGL